ncbi:MAG: hypothetical protein AB9872_07450 [Solidesulfovibrio sp.]
MPSATKGFHPLETRNDGRVLRDVTATTANETAPTAKRVRSKGSGPVFAEKSCSRTPNFGCAGTTICIHKISEKILQYLDFYATKFFDSLEF